MSVAIRDTPVSLTVGVGTRQRSTTGAVRMTVETDGERVLRATPLLGAAHRGIEKLVEESPYARVPMLLACANHLAITHTATAYAMALEALGGIRVPARGSSLRAAAMEIERAASHLAWLGAWTCDAGLPRVGDSAARVRAVLVGALEHLTGTRSGRGYVVPGGVAVQPSAEALDAACGALAEAERGVEGLASSLDTGGAFASVARATGVVGREVCRESGATGPNLRASGAALDARRYLPRQPYPSVELAIPLGTSGDCWDRCYVRLEETRWALRIAQSLLGALPGGAHVAKVDRDIRPPAGESYAAVESPRGELGVHIVSDGAPRPYRLRLRSPSFHSLGAAAAALEGALLDVAPFILGSFDLMASEMER